MEKRILEISKKRKADGLMVINMWNVCREAEKCVQPIRDKAANIARLNRKDFPLKTKEITEFLLFVESGLYKLHHFLFSLSHYAPDGKDGMYEIDKVRFFRMHSKGKFIPKADQNEIESLMQSLKMIMLERYSWELPNIKRAINGLKKKISNIQRQIYEAKEFEDMRIAERPFLKKNLTIDALPALKANFNVKLAK